MQAPAAAMNRPMSPAEGVGLAHARPRPLAPLTPPGLGPPLKREWRILTLVLKTSAEVRNDAGGERSTRRFGQIHGQPSVLLRDLGRMLIADVLGQSCHQPRLERFVEFLR